MNESDVKGFEKKLVFPQRGSPREPFAKTTKMLAACSRGCITCSAYTATRENAWAEIAEVAKQWDGPDEVSEPTDVICYGCNSEKPCDFSHITCQVRICAKTFNYKFCWDCPEFPCEIIELLHKAFTRVWNENAKSTLDEREAQKNQEETVKPHRTEASPGAETHGTMGDLHVSR